jgi:hypothetical protein
MFRQTAQLSEKAESQIWYHGQKLKSDEIGKLIDFVRKNGKKPKIG